SAQQELRPSDGRPPEGRLSWFRGDPFFCARRKVRRKLPTGVVRDGLMRMFFRVHLVVPGIP
ncbi:MAG TPA: hypothetical protein DIT89_07245, partial [Planctomycetaceae bacterium]|nr:hypothetical protein [Planctomycetaceae bacterium]